MSTPGHDLRHMSDVRLQKYLSRLLADRRDAEAAREARLRRLPTPKTQSQAAPKPQPRQPEPFEWVDSAVFLTPLAIVSVLILVAHWSGWLA